MWSNGMSLIPDSDFCAPENLTDDVAQIKTCISAKGESVCAPPCKWRRGSQPATALPTGDSTNTDLDLTGDMFTKNFCHPDSTEDWDTNQAICLAQKTEDTCKLMQTSKCAWTSGKELIPGTDFCAPTLMTDSQ